MAMMMMRNTENFTKVKLRDEAGYNNKTLHFKKLISKRNSIQLTMDWKIFVHHSTELRGTFLEDPKTFSQFNSFPT